MNNASTTPIKINSWQDNQIKDLTTRSSLREPKGRSKELLKVLKPSVKEECERSCERTSQKPDSQTPVQIFRSPT
jgi:hypothetical protein